jgi:predicted nucleic acid-binding protein
MNVVDSSGWLEYFAGSKNAANFAKAIEDTQRLLVPSIVLLEVFKRMAELRGEDAALQVVAAMHHGQVIALDAGLALNAAMAGRRHKLPLADSIVYATAVREKATLWTQDADFDGLPGVRYFAKA